MCVCVCVCVTLRYMQQSGLGHICKYYYGTMYVCNLQSTSSLYFLLGGNPKVKISIQTMFSLAHHHGNMLREGWKNLLDCLLTLFSAKLLPECMVEVRSTIDISTCTLRNVFTYGPIERWVLYNVHE